jgi:hypothetical protein
MGLFLLCNQFTSIHGQELLDQSQPRKEVQWKKSFSGWPDSLAGRRRGAGFRSWKGRSRYLFTRQKGVSLTAGKSRPLNVSAYCIDDAERGNGLARPGIAPPMAVPAGPSEMLARIGGIGGWAIIADAKGACRLRFMIRIWP